MTGRNGVDSVDVVVVGAGLGGLFMLYRLRECGFDVAGVERARDVGGTWLANCYPGARVDTNSLNYSYSFDGDLQQEWEWSERYATQPEILDYIRHVADRFGLRDDYRFGTSVRSASWDGAAARWRLSLSTGDTVDTRVIVSAAGVLSATNVPPFPGIESFAGTYVHTSRWPAGVEVEGARVGVVGTGSTGVQLIPQLARRAAHLDVFQRTANYCISQKNGPIAADFVAAWKADYDRYRELARYSAGGSAPPPTPEHSGLELTEELQEELLESAWAEGSNLHMMGVFNDVLTNAGSNAVVAEFIRRKIRAIVEDPTTAELLCPRDYAFGTKRPVLEDGYYATFNRDNVRLVDVRADPIDRIVPEGLVTRSGARYDLDVLVLATGFDAITGAIERLNLTGRHGETLEEKWSQGPQTLLGMATAGFPNLFFLTGPGSPSVLGNVVTSLELHVEWIADLLVHMRSQKLDVAEVEPGAEVAWAKTVREAAERTLYLDTDSWYLGANIPGKPRVFLAYVGGVGNFRRHCEQVASDGYSGIRFASVAGARWSEVGAEMGS